MKSIPAVLTIGVALVLIPADSPASPPLAEQLRFGCDLSHDSRYLWRGAVRSEGATTGVDGYAAWQEASLIVTSGLWTVAYDHGAGTAESNGSHLGRRFLGELEWWFQCESQWHGLRSSLGATRTWFFSRDRARSTAEARDSSRLYGHLDQELPGFFRRVTPGLRVEWEPGADSPPYLTPAVLWQVKVLPYYLVPLGSIYLKGEAGFGPRFNNRDEELRFDYGRLGLTLPAGPFSGQNMDIQVALEGSLTWLRVTRGEGLTREDVSCVGVVGLRVGFSSHRREKKDRSPW